MSSVLVLSDVAGISSALSICLRGIFNYTPRIAGICRSRKGRKVRKSAESPLTHHQIFKDPGDGRVVTVLMVVTKQVPLVFPFPLSTQKSILIKASFDDFI